jgi:hypothetical protein
MMEWFDRACRPAWPAERLALVRVLVGLYGTFFLLIRSRHLMSYAAYGGADFHPVGVVSVLEQPLEAIITRSLVVVTIALSLGFLVGWRYRIVAPLYAAALLWVLTYTNSFGFIMHTDNLFVVYVLVLAVSPAADTFSWDAMRSPRSDDLTSRELNGDYGWALRLMCVVCVAAYLLAGYAKLKHGGAAYFDSNTLRNYIAYDNVRKIELGSIHSPLGAWLLPFSSVFQGLGILSIALELGAPLALVHRRIGHVWSLLVFGFHWGVLALMAIGFPFQLTGLAFVPFLAIEGIKDRALVLRVLRTLRLVPAESPPT